MKKSVSTTSLKEAYATYLELMWTNFFEVKSKLYHVEPLDVSTAILHSILLLDHVFWYMFHYSNNLELCRFVTERSKLLYVEFLQMSRNHDVMRQSNSFPTISDAFNFSLRKSIGTLTVGNHQFSVKMEKISLIRENVRKLFSIMNSFYPHPENISRNTENQHENLTSAYFLPDSILKHMFQNSVTLWVQSLEAYEISDEVVHFAKGINSFISFTAFFDWWFQTSVHNSGNMSILNDQMDILRDSLRSNSHLLESLILVPDNELNSFLKVWSVAKQIYFVS